MKARRSGVIVNILGNGASASTPAISRCRGQRVLMAFTRWAAMSGHGCVVGVNPGAGATERLVRLMQRGRTRLATPRRKELAASFPFGPRTVDEIAATVVLSPPTCRRTPAARSTIDGGMAIAGR